MGDMEGALVSLYSRLQHLQWSLLYKQRHINQLLEQQSKRLSEQDKIISHLTSRLSPGSSPTSLEEVEYLALARLPKVQGQEQEAPAASFQGVQEVPRVSFQDVQDVPGASFQGVQQVPGASFQGVQQVLGASFQGVQQVLGASFQGVQQVVGASFQGVQQVPRSSFQVVQEVGDSDSAIQLDCSYSSDSDSVTIRQSASQRSSETARMVKNGCRKQKTTTAINPRV